MPQAFIFVLDTRQANSKPSRRGSGLPRLLWVIFARKPDTARPAASPQGPDRRSRGSKARPHWHAKLAA